MKFKDYINEDFKKDVDSALKEFGGKTKVTFMRDYAVIIVQPKDKRQLTFHLMNKFGNNAISSRSGVDDMVQVYKGR